MELDRAQEALTPATACLERKLQHSATSRAYYGMFWAAQVALSRVGIRRTEWSHPGLQASFVTELVRRRKIYPPVLAQYFNRALQLRLDADYRREGVSLNQATQTVRRAQQFLSAVRAEAVRGGH